MSIVPAKMKVQRLFLGCSLSSHPLKGVGVPAQVIIERMTFPFSASIPVERYEAAARKTDAAFAAIVAEAPWVLDVPQKAKALAEENASRRSKFKRLVEFGGKPVSGTTPTRWSLPEAMPIWRSYWITFKTRSGHRANTPLTHD